MTLSEKLGKAAQEFSLATVEALETDQGVHAETVIAATARMAGTFLFRSFGFDLPGAEPGQPVLSEEANEQGPRLMEILSGALLDLGISLNNEETSGLVPLENEPKLDFLDTQKKLEPPFTITTKNLGLSPKEASEAAALAVALLIQQAASVLNPNTAFAIAIYGFIEGSKTYPAPVDI